MKKTFKLHYESLRNISSPEDIEHDRKVLCGHVKASQILDIPTNHNVRDYILEAEGRKRKRPSSVHRAIEDALKNQPDNFSILNGGIVIVASDYTADNKKGIISIENPSIINGAQTQGILRNYFEETPKEEINDVSITFELIITQDESLVAEVSIARNYQNDVKPISIYGTRGHLDDLDNSIQKTLKGKKLKKSETDIADNYIDTEKLLQIITVLTPDSLFVRDDENKEVNKVFAYSQKSKCLKKFSELYVNKDKSKKHQELYQFFVDIAPEAYLLYEKWKKHQGFRGTGLRCIKREKNGKIIEIPDGLIFPILSSLSVFAEKINEEWKINIPPSFDESEIIISAKSAYTDIARSVPHQMGRNKACYSHLQQITSLIKKFSPSNNKAA